ncbi:molybdenum cofactor biosynthesis protein MoaE [Novosphingobium sp.]|uniref:molybdenum cofactor biosynthesis protein MoaE n=1 Tax=Novosphingobium sp. TaxID=1874826 RepID=UPI0026312324|nr:molybdenum cofactor biosynthesis protein MoaE [Novosphingobium sp.]
MSRTVRLIETGFDPAEELRRFTAETGEVGAIVSFTGVARGLARDGAPLQALVLEAYRSVTLRSMEAIAADAHARFPITASLVLHRAGRILPGEPIVLVATAAPHRRAAFDAADYLMDRLKSEAVFWKREEGVSGAVWIEPTTDDAAALARWGRTPQEAACPE